MNVAKERRKFFLKFKNVILGIILSLFISMPLNTFAYSKNLIPGGETIGIEVNSNGVLIVGFYKVNDTYPAKDAGFSVGDIILKINQQEINSIEQMVTVVSQSEDKKIDVTISRDHKEDTLSFELMQDEKGILKTGLYVKDNITGLGTLTYIDPETRKFGALGHEILEKTTAKKFEIKEGKIFEAEVTGITKSATGHPGEKNAIYNKENVFGTINKNIESGIFGTYNTTLPEDEPLEVATPNEVKTGEATIKTVTTDDTVKNYKIQILKVNPEDEMKNILFEVTDPTLLEETGGIVQGMSGSPIIQNHKIIGAVTHVIVSDAKKGYGIFITKMLEDSEKSE